MPRFGETEKIQTRKKKKINRRIKMERFHFDIWSVILAICIGMNISNIIIGIATTITYLSLVLCTVGLVSRAMR